MASSSRRVAGTLAAAATVAAAVLALPFLGGSSAYAASTATINGGTVLQPIDGFGFSEAFGRTGAIRALSSANQRAVLDQLLSPTTGAGLSILRLGIASGASSIQPTNPGGPNATPRYVWNADDDGQVWLSKQAQSYGLSRFYADAWSAPGYMKDNGDEANGGTLCGVTGTSCASGDWRKAYANYLVQYTKFYAQEGIGITDLGFTNEPNWTATYSSMRLTPAQAVDLAKVVGPVATANGLKMTCCDAVAWNSEATYSAAIVADATANQLVTTHTGHSYGSGPSTPLSVGGKHTWMSEWSPDGTTWNEAWDDGSGYDGFTVAQAVHTALTGGNVNGYVYWYGVSTGATRAFIQANGTEYRTSKRLWAMANYSRFIRPGASRIGSSSPDANLRLSAFRNPDGTVAVVVLNAATAATSVSYTLQNAGITTGTATPYLTNSGASTTAQSPVGVSGGAFTATVPARSLVTYLIRPGSGPSPSPSVSPSASRSPSPSSSPTSSPSGACSATYQITNTWSGGFQAEVTVRAGAAPVNGWTVRWTFPNGQTITQLWNGDYTASGSAVTVRNVAYNASLPAAGSTTFGFLATAGATNSPPAAVTCTSP